MSPIEELRNDLQAAADNADKFHQCKVAAYYDTHVSALDSLIAERDQLKARAELEAERDALRKALEALYTEQNDAPLERRRKEWAAAVGLASQALYGTQEQPKPRTCGECAAFDAETDLCAYEAMNITGTSSSCDEFEPRDGAEKGQL